MGKKLPMVYWNHITKLSDYLDKGLLWLFGFAKAK